MRAALNCRLVGRSRARGSSRPIYGIGIILIWSSPPRSQSGPMGMAKSPPARCKRRSILATAGAGSPSHGPDAMKWTRSRVTVMLNYLTMAQSKSRSRTNGNEAILQAEPETSSTACSAGLVAPSDDRFEGAKPPTAKPTVMTALGHEMHSA